MSYIIGEQTVRQRNHLTRLFVVSAAALVLIFPATMRGHAQAGGAALGSRFLPANKLTITSATRVDLDRGSATLPLHKGMYHGMPVWYVITDASDQGVANRLGVNFAPKLANITDGCPGCAQQVSSTMQGMRLGHGTVEFRGVPDFSPTRMLKPSMTGFPPVAVQPGAVAGMGYSPFVRLNGSPVVYNAPIVAVGGGPFDVMGHTNTQDRVLGIDLGAMTVDLLFVRAFGDGQPILYLTFEASEPLTAVIERSTFAPGLGLAPFAGGSDRPGAARAAIFTFANGKTGPSSPPAQGLTHVIVDGANAQEANLGNKVVLDALRRGGDAHNVIDNFPTLRDPNLAHKYSPLWDLHIGVWSKSAVAQGLNVAQTDANVIRMLAAKDMVTSPGGVPLSAAGIVINCPVLGFTGQTPVAPQAPMTAAAP